VAWGGIEPPTQGFSTLIDRFDSVRNQASLNAENLVLTLCHIAARLDLEEIATAHEIIEGGQMAGNVVLRVSS
jgi:hypothetical protein